MWTAGAAFDSGDFLAVDAEGFCQKATTGQYILAMALASTTAKRGYRKSCDYPCWI